MPSHTRRGRVLLGGSALPHRKVLSFATLPGAQSKKLNQWLIRTRPRPRSSPCACRPTSVAPSVTVPRSAASVSPPTFERPPWGTKLYPALGSETPSAIELQPEGEITVFNRRPAASQFAPCGCRARKRRSPSPPARSRMPPRHRWRPSGDRAPPAVPRSADRPLP